MHLTSRYLAILKTDRLTRTQMRESMDKEGGGCQREGNQDERFLTVSPEEAGNLKPNRSCK